MGEQGTGGIWVLFMENRGDIGPVHVEQGRYGSCSWGIGEIWFLFMANRGGVGPGQDSGTGKEWVLFRGSETMNTGA